MIKQNEEEAPFGEDDLTVWEPPRIDLSTKAEDLAKVMDEILPEGRNVKTEELVNHMITIHYMRPVKGENGMFLWCILTDENGELLNTSIGGQVLAPKLWAARERLPLRFKLTFVPQGNFGGYYDYDH